jgi:two-component system, chemotaxis family, chemotaxis protein CheV
LNKIAARAEARGRLVSNSVQVLLTDVEMPEMNDYMLTRNIKSDPRLAGISVLMHSPLSSEANRVMGKNLGVDANLARVDPLAGG